MNTAARYLGRALDAMEGLLLWIAMAATVAVMLLTAVDALGRYLFNAPMKGAFEITEDYLMGMIVFLALGYAFTSGAHVSVTFFTRRFSPRLRRYLNVVLLLISLIFFALITWVGWRQFASALAVVERTTSSLGYPMAPAYFVVPLGAAVVSLRIIQYLLQGGTGGEEEDEVFS